MTNDVDVSRSKRSRRQRPTGGPSRGLFISLLIIALVIGIWWGRQSTTPSPDRATSTPTTQHTSGQRTSELTADSATPTPPVASSPSAAASSVSPSASPGDDTIGTSPMTPIPAESTHPTSTGARLAIIIDDCGQWPKTERGFIGLPIPLTLSVLPHVAFGAEISRAASDAGKGVILHLPMETVSGLYPGPGTIKTAMDDATIKALVSSDLADVPLARGANNHEGSKATADARVMGDVADVLAESGRFFVDSRTSSKSVGERVARAHGIPAAARDVFLDNVDSVPAVEERLREAAAVARSQGSAIAIGHPRTATLAAVRKLTPAMAASGITFVLVSDLVK